jgi:hypothetical protein
MMRARRASLLLLGVLATLLLAVPAQAQFRSKASIRTGIETSLLQQRQAMANLQEQRPERALALIWEAYVNLRAAHGNITANNEAAKYPDPVFKIQNERIERARARLLQARDLLRDIVAKQWVGENGIQRVREFLAEALRETEVVSALTL